VSLGYGAASSSNQTDALPAPLPDVSLRKRSRDSNTSNVSLDVETFGDGSQLKTTLPVADAPTSSRKEDGHTRKKLRLSVRGDDDTFEESVRVPGNVVTDGEEEEDEDEVDPEIENSNDSVREYLVPTKTGDSPATTFRPANQSINDPSFFSAPSSPAVLTPGRRTAPQVNENVAQIGGSILPRQSLPVTALPFPIVSPFAKKTQTSSSFGTPAKTALGNRSNQHFTNLLKSTSKAAVASPSTSKQSLARPRTPVAPRTLYGTEEESRFGDQFDTAEEDNTGTDGTWSRFRGGSLF
jgi:hypothetical protein